MKKILILSVLFSNFAFATSSTDDVTAKDLKVTSESMQNVQPTQEANVGNKKNRKFSISCTNSNGVVFKKKDPGYGGCVTESQETTNARIDPKNKATTSAGFTIGN